LEERLGVRGTHRHSGDTVDRIAPANNPDLLTGLLAFQPPWGRGWDEANNGVSAPSDRRLNAPPNFFQQLQESALLLDVTDRSGASFHTR
jgi:hypothetical protein